ncbi:hypothetical protein CTRI78_v007226 [Colletotrichum trifolii]|uniref:Uncharacterized protein n=1 Tax=Colletotrichum trifolii TaxID=5466 RepID=A0A4R8RJZ7_COLTR|nr:hypothetical protein CTRI78_v007226 [Colletotrichum trifolii]
MNKNSAQSAWSVLHEGNESLDQPTLNAFCFNRVNSYVEFRMLSSFYQDLIKGYSLSPKDLHDMQCRGGKVLFLKIKQRLESGPGVLSPDQVSWFEEHRYIWDPSVGDGDPSADPGVVLDPEMREATMAVDRKVYEEMLSEMLLADCDPFMRLRSGPDYDRSLVQTLTDQMYGKDESTTEILKQAMADGKCPEAAPLRHKAIRGYGFERIDHYADAGRLLDVYVHLVNTCHVDFDTIHKTMLKGLRALRRLITDQFEKNKNEIPSDLMGWFNDSAWVFDPSDGIGSWKSALRYLDTKLVCSDFQSRHPGEEALANQELQRVLDMFRRTKPGDDSFDICRLIQRRSKRFDCKVQVEIPRFKEKSEVIEQEAETKQAEGVEGVFFDGKWDGRWIVGPIAKPSDAKWINRKWLVVVVKS